MGRRGFPEPSQGEEIPLPARIVSVAEAYDNLTQAGSLREQAAEEIVRQAGFAFDPAVVAALAKAVRASTGAVAAQ
jgi:HD-GYP domain-containing protein (c-di-GMP phosphodiesterase class II)